jgi:hypothetical protein
MSQAKWDYLLKLDDELLRGGVVLSEWVTFLVRDADLAYCAGAHLSAILVAQSAIEAHLRYEYHDGPTRQSSTLYDLIENSPLLPELREDLHSLRRYRNRWVHVKDPREDADLLTRPEYHEAELERIATTAVRAMRQVLYLEQCL